MLNVGGASVVEEPSGVETLEILSGQGGSDEREKEMASYDSGPFSLFRVLNGDQNGVGGDAVDSEVDFDERSPRGMSRLT